MKFIASVIAAALSFSLSGTLEANTYGSVEPLANAAVIDTRPLMNQPLKIREAFAARLLQCGLVRRVVDVLSSTGAITTINDLNTHFAVGAGGFAGRTNPSYVYTVIDNGPNAASGGWFSPTTLKRIGISTSGSDGSLLRTISRAVYIPAFSSVVSSFTGISTDSPGATVPEKSGRFTNRPEQPACGINASALG